MAENSEQSFSSVKNESLEPTIERRLITKPVILGLCCGFLSGSFYGLCTAAVKYIEDLDSGQLSFYQYVAYPVFALPMLVKSGKSVLGRKKSTKYWLILAGIFDAILIYTSFVSVRYLSLSEATAISSSIPVFVTLSARIFLKEKLNKIHILAIILSVVGVALVSKVPLLLTSRSVYTRENIVGILAALGSVAAYSGFYLVLRKLRDVDLFVILFTEGSVAALITAAYTYAFGHFTWSVCGIQQWMVIPVVVFSYMSVLTMTKALELQQAGLVSVVKVAGNIILSFILDVTIFRGKPEVYTISGTVLVISSVVLIGFRKWITDTMTLLKNMFLKKYCH